MKEKYILYILIIILTVITNSNCFPATQSIFKYKHDDDPKDVIAYWTPENMKNTILVPGEDSENNGDGKKDESSEENSGGDAVGPDAVGKLFFIDPFTGNRYSCYASVIDTGDGNIGLTAAHCLYGCQNGFVWYAKMLFCPGYNNGCTVSVPVSHSATLTTNCSYPTDYGMIKFDYNHGKLQEIGRASCRER